jgi:hypothetical protein
MVTRDTQIETLLKTLTVSTNKLQTVETQVHIAETTVQTVQTQVETVETQMQIVESTGQSVHTQGQTVENPVEKKVREVEKTGFRTRMPLTTAWDSSTSGWWLSCEIWIPSFDMKWRRCGTTRVVSVPSFKLNLNETWRRSWRDYVS